MPVIFHISATESLWWKKTTGGWEQTTDPGRGSVWVVTDLPEETFAQISIPRLFGSDRAAFIQRQMSTRFPETQYRLALPTGNPANFMERLMPPHQTLVAIEPGERIRSALAHIQAPVAGVWCTSMLLTHLGQSASLPKDLFIVLYQGTSMRILFLKQRTPVLTRLVSVAPTVAEQSSEILRTMRHLENTHVIARDATRYAVWLLGTANGLDAALATDRLNAVAAPAAWGKTPGTDLRHRLFDLVQKAPPGQMAPQSIRAAFLARKVAKTSWLLAALCIAAALWLGGNSVLDALKARQEGQQTQSHIDELTSQIGEVDAAIEALGISPESVRQALALDTQEITSAPSLQDDLQRMAQAVSAVPGLRLKSLSWTILAPDEPACAKHGPEEPTEAATDEPAPAQRLVEVELAPLTPDALGPRARQQQASLLSQQLRLIPHAQVRKDPAEAMREQDISAGTLNAPTEQDTPWCLTLPGTLPTEPARAEGQP